ncbi:ATP-binding protein [Nostoc sp. DedQUE09]|uniref:ATP-binding protein n=1 Tax=Nostoc sp. DedQUE09 TaxID=3075394 RepID=UPI002AD322CC|nr:ATP-binding protein [Nostoc sp. DedQUE09]MDZ7955394.1 ATP-binding protein [Nostoc sp. DedQUE09]
MVKIQGIPDNIHAEKAAVLRSRLIRDITSFCDDTGIKKVNITIDTNHNLNKSNSNQVESENATNKDMKDEISIEQRSQQYQPQPPAYNFDLLVLPETVLENLLAAIDSIEVESVVFEKWNLKQIQPFPSTVLNFWGKPGTGKTLAAHAIANRLGKKILLASYADIESKFHGDGPKNLKAIFYAAERDNAVLFIDEADSLLSKRLTEVNSGSEQAINSMRSELLVRLEQFRGIVIFATNLVENYDVAFETRVRHIHFPMPDENCRYQIWQKHLPQELPLASDVSIDELAKVTDVCGREIREAVIDAAIRVALKAKKSGFDPASGEVKLKDLVEAIERKKAERITPQSRELEPEEKEEVTRKVKSAWEAKQKEQEDSTS